tara:strand:+ start:108 stop:632 length:525 start_codon:yes stop_codon:yes gene_type:complete
MKIKKTNIFGCYEVFTDGIFDDRGSFSRIFCENILKKNNIKFKIKQINFANTKKRGTFRGFHYQVNPHSENKLVKCIKGSIFDVVIDLRKKSKTYKKLFKTKLYDKENKLLLIPRGCAHGYLSLNDNTEIIYFVDNVYNSSSERGIKYSDPDIKIKWPIKIKNVSVKDLNWPKL